MLIWLALLGCAGAQSYPDKPIRVISGPQIGTSGDIVGRLLATKVRGSPARDQFAGVMILVSTGMSWAVKPT
jgi:tripartite-type tricarboxylate transporter receptor subunit TctC